MIIISFHDQHLHNTCRSLKAAEDCYGSVHAQAVVTFISEAYALESAEELIAFHINQAKINPDDSLSIEIGSEYVATLIPVGQRFGTDFADRVDWATVKRLKIMEIARKL